MESHTSQLDLLEELNIVFQKSIYFCWIVSSVSLLQEENQPLLETEKEKRTSPLPLCSGVIAPDIVFPFTLE